MQKLIGFARVNSSQNKRVLPGLHEVKPLVLPGQFETTRNFYLVIRGDLLERARQARERGMQQLSAANAF
jgi:hypothetical protein